VRGELDAAVEAGERAVEVAARLDALTVGLAERAVANVLFYRGVHADALRWTARMMDATRDLGVPSLVAHACYMRSVAETSIGNQAAAIELAERSAAAAAESGSPTAHAQADYARGVSVEATDPTRALQLFDRSVQHAESVGNRWIRAFALTESLWIRAQQGEALAALAGYRDVIDTWFRGGDWVNQWFSLRHVFAILEALGHDEVAATLYGALEASGVMQAFPIEPANADEFGHAVERLSARLDARAFVDAVERGRALRDEEVVRYALAEISSI
jgi:hypothetical protein